MGVGASPSSSEVTGKEFKTLWTLRGRRRIASSWGVCVPRCVSGLVQSAFGRHTFTASSETIRGVGVSRLNSVRRTNNILLFCVPRTVYMVMMTWRDGVVCSHPKCDRICDGILRPEHIHPVNVVVFKRNACGDLFMCVPWSLVVGRNEPNDSHPFAFILRIVENQSVYWCTGVCMLISDDNLYV